MSARFLPYILGAGALVSGVLLYGHMRFNAGEAKVQAKWDAENVLEQKAFDEAASRTAELENQLDLSNWRIEHELTPKLAAADARGQQLAQRLRDYFARDSRPVSEAPPAAGDPSGASGGGSGAGPVAVDLGAVISACQRDAIRLNGWIQWWEAIPAEMKRAPE